MPETKGRTLEEIARSWKAWQTHGLNRKRFVRYGGLDAALGAKAGCSRYWLSKWSEHESPF